MMFRCNGIQGRFMVCLILFKGNVIPRDVPSSVFELNGKKQFNLFISTPLSLKKVLLTKVTAQFQIQKQQILSYKPA
ncbi:unnamed protein product [Paramecium pentaurelia]|uniref:Uncharacterized protein n=1 Tax=Paramecium pentaurelia TaxID=43138 RepID=A0A8S1WIY2_9CILI|nr:unnamed protein product [Paramecium pentaurelia]CAD8189375.1 unnamed protein product [Paramecium pentaurelia]